LSTAIVWPAYIVVANQHDHVVASPPSLEVIQINSRHRGDSGTLWKGRPAVRRMKKLTLEQVTAKAAISTNYRTRTA
jgi:hypothetical protein